MSTLTEFLLARIAEDEAVARAAASAPRPRGGWGSEDDPAGERWETRRGRGMLYAPTVENHADAALWDDEGGCDYMAPAPDVGTHIARHDPARVLAECEAKRRIVEWHKSWPVLAQTPPTFEPIDDSANPSSIAMRASQQMAWLTEQEYRDRFGAEPPTGPVLRLLALPYADHPDYQDAWRP